MSGRVHGVLRRPGVGWLVASLALAIAAIATLGGRSSTPTQSVVVARAEIPPGVRLSEDAAPDLLERVEVPAEPSLHGVLASTGDAVGAVVAVGLAPGELVTHAALEGRRDIGLRPLAPGERAVSVPVGASGPGVRPGASVDVVLATPEGGSAQFVVSAAEVLAVDGEDAITGASAVSLRVSTQEALDVASAATTGSELRLLVRSQDERDPVIAP